MPIASKGPELLEAAFDVCGFFSHSCDSIIIDEIKERVVKHVWTPCKVRLGMGSVSLRVKALAYTGGKEAFTSFERKLPSIEVSSKTL